MLICRYDKDVNPNSCGGCQYGCIERKPATINKDFEKAISEMEKDTFIKKGEWEMNKKLREEVAIQLANARNISLEEAHKILRLLDDTYLTEVLKQNEIFKKRAKKFAEALEKIGDSDNLDDVKIALAALKEAED